MQVNMWICVEVELLRYLTVLFVMRCRSEIHGRGLFCKRDIDAGEMIIEYAGEVIRAALCDKREKYYESKVQNLYTFV